LGDNGLHRGHPTTKAEILSAELLNNLVAGFHVRSVRFSSVRGKIRGRSAVDPRDQEETAVPYDEIYLAEDGQQIGPLNEAQVRDMVAQGRANESTYAWIPGAPDWQPAGQLLPELFAMTIAMSADQIHAPAAQAAAPASSTDTVYAPVPEPEPEPELVAEPAEPEPSFDAVSLEPEAVLEPEPDLTPAPTAGGEPTTSFDVDVVGEWRLPHILLNDDSVSLAPGALHYAQGHIAVSWPIPSAGTPAAAPRFSVCRGNGRLTLAPSLGECTVLELKGEEWYADADAFLACDQTVTAEPRANSSESGGSEIFEVRLTGRGKVFIRAQGAVERVELGGDTLIVNGGFALARTSGVELTLEAPQDGSPGPLRTYRGSGTVLLAPLPRRSSAS
jgi:hypothetical protein